MILCLQVGRTHLMAGHTTFSLNPARIAVLYAVMGVLWIVLSDSAVEWVFGTGPFALFCSWD